MIWSRGSTLAIFVLAASTLILSGLTSSAPDPNYERACADNKNCQYVPRVEVVVASQEAIRDNERPRNLRYDPAMELERPSSELLNLDSQAARCFSSTTEERDIKIKLTVEEVSRRGYPTSLNVSRVEQSDPISDRELGCLRSVFRHFRGRPSFLFMGRPDRVDQEETRTVQWEFKVTPGVVHCEDTERHFCDRSSGHSSSFEWSRDRGVAPEFFFRQTRNRAVRCFSNFDFEEGESELEISIDFEFRPDEQGRFAGSGILDRSTDDRFTEEQAQCIENRVNQRWSSSDGDDISESVQLRWTIVVYNGVRCDCTHRSPGERRGQPG